MSIRLRNYIMNLENEAVDAMVDTPVDGVESDIVKADLMEDIKRQDELADITDEMMEAHDDITEDINVIDQALQQDPDSIPTEEVVAVQEAYKHYIKATGIEPILPTISREDITNDKVTSLRTMQEGMKDIQSKLDGYIVHNLEAYDAKNKGLFNKLKLVLSSDARKVKKLRNKLSTYNGNIDFRNVSNRLNDIGYGGIDLIFNNDIINSKNTMIKFKKYYDKALANVRAVSNMYKVGYGPGGTVVVSTDADAMAEQDYKINNFDISTMELKSTIVTADRMLSLANVTKGDFKNVGLVGAVPKNNNLDLTVIRYNEKDDLDIEIINTYINVSSKIEIKNIQQAIDMCDGYLEANSELYTIFQRSVMALDSFIEKIKDALPDLTDKRALTRYLKTNNAVIKTTRTIPIELYDCVTNMGRIIFN